MKRRKRKPKILIIRYNKSANESFDILQKHLSELNVNVQVCDIIVFGHKRDLLDYPAIDVFLSQYMPFDIVIIADVFWPTGQSICQWCEKFNVYSIFMQHGQWISTDSKRVLRFYPNKTLLFGYDVYTMCKKWPYSYHSKCQPVGSPRYDQCSIQNQSGSYIFFSPPVIEEILHDCPSGRLREPFLRCLESLSGFDHHFPVVMQPHYREHCVQILKDLFPKANFVESDKNTLDLIKSSSKVVCSRNSTVVLDTISCGKHVVCTDLVDHDCCFFRRGYFGQFASESSDRDSFLSNLESKDPVITKYIERSLRYILLGCASDRIIHIIKSIIG